MPHPASSVASSLPLKLLTTLATTAVLLATLPVHARDDRKPLSSLVRKGDIRIWDEQYLRGNPKGWTVPPDYHATFGRRGGSHVWSGRFGLASGWLLYTTWRRLVPLSDAAYGGGETGIYDGHVSNLITPPFELKLDYVTFLISGGNSPDRACMNLLIDGEIVRSSTGRSNDMLEWVAFDVKALRGKTARIQVLDTSTAATDYITVDCICQSPDTKSAVRVIASPPQAGGDADVRAETMSGKHTGKLSLVDDKLLIGKEEVDLNDILRLDTGIESSGSVSGKRLELVNGDVLKADVLGLEKSKLVISHELLGELRVPVQHIAQAVLLGGESIDSRPGMLVHSGGRKIPGKLTWIGKDEIAIDCILGALKLPRARVRAYVFARKTPRAADADIVVLADGSTLSGKLTVEGGALALKHDALGKIELQLSEVAHIKRSVPDLVTLSKLKGEVRERVGPIQPPSPFRLSAGSDEVLRIFPRTVIRYKLGKTDVPRCLKASLSPLANSRIPVRATVRAGDKEWTLTVAPDAKAIAVDIKLGMATEMDVIVDCGGKISLPCGLDWSNAFITEDIVVVEPVEETEEKVDEDANDKIEDVGAEKDDDDAAANVDDGTVKKADEDAVEDTQQ